ncbi:hypothetical protein N7495_008306 [Penicillium taxi]|uniref:uncharacterized protein n=1 Tax=Penicillium taxi TaxID=168475 RepID=UPI00254562BC|nr:uncharacterized protein N7495_008306 [Penicillium taxi]KAJ5888265.1 hypothetical protein N7495_008306 [Penicillium taxi]
MVQLLGFTPEVAEKIFRSYSERPDPRINHYELIDYVMIQILPLMQSKSDATLQHELESVGLNQQIVRAIADPVYRKILWTQDPYYWVLDTI